AHGPPSGWVLLGVAYPTVSATHHHGLHVQLRQGRSYLRIDNTANGQIELPQTRPRLSNPYCKHAHGCGEATRRYHMNAEGLACGGSNRLPSMPHPHTCAATVHPVNRRTKGRGGVRAWLRFATAHAATGCNGVGKP